MLISALVAVGCWIYMGTVKRKLGFVVIGIKTHVWLDIIVLDDATGTPLQGAEVEMPWLHTDWRGRPELQTGDLRRENTPAHEMPPPYLTDEGGRVTVIESAILERQLKHRFGGLLPVAGSPELVFFIFEGVRINAPGYTTWVNYLEDLRLEDGRNLILGSRLPIVVRLKRAEIEATSARMPLP
ncbi:hypothetical protein EP7_002861 [Isosphaeraceae bacterium EP7]